MWPGRPRRTPARTAGPSRRILHLRDRSAQLVADQTTGPTGLTAMQPELGGSGDPEQAVGRAVGSARARRQSRIYPGAVPRPAHLPPLLRELLRRSAHASPPPSFGSQEDLSDGTALPAGAPTLPPPPTMWGPLPDRQQGRTRGMPPIGPPPLPHRTVPEPARMHRHCEQIHTAGGSSEVTRAPTKSGGSDGPVPQFRQVVRQPLVSDAAASAAGTAEYCHGDTRVSTTRSRCGSNRRHRAASWRPASGSVRADHRRRRSAAADQNVASSFAASDSARWATQTWSGMPRTEHEYPHSRFGLYRRPLLDPTGVTPCFPVDSTGTY